MKTQLAITEQYLRNTPLPEATETYTVIPHSFVIDTVRRELQANNFTITEEKFYEGDQGEVAEGEFYIENNQDPSMGLVFHWQNSYNKKVKFGCAIVGMIYDNNTGMIGSTGAEWMRKHTGTALEEAEQTIIELCAQVQEHFAGILQEKEQMKSIPLTDSMYGRIMGELYFERELLNQTQAALIIKERKRPMFEYQDKDTVWGLYKYIMFGIQDAYIGTWQVCQQRVHMVVMANVHQLLEEMHDYTHRPTQQTTTLDAAIPLEAIQITNEVPPAANIATDIILEDTSETIAEELVTKEADHSVSDAKESIKLPTDNELQFAWEKDNEEAISDMANGKDAFIFEDENEGLEAACTQEEVIEELLNTSSSEVAIIYQFVETEFNEMETIAQNTTRFFEKYPEPKKSKKAKATPTVQVDDVATKEPEASEEINSLSDAELLAQISAEGGSAVELSEEDKQLLGLVESQVSAPQGIDFLAIEEAVIPAAVPTENPKITEFITTMFNRPGESPYTIEPFDGMIKIQLTETKEIGYIRN